MSTCSDLGAWGPVFSCLSSLLVIGCFGVEQVDTRPSGAPTIKIDDFEDGDTLPSSALFGPWTCFAFAGVQAPPKCSIVTGFKGGLALAFALQVPPTYAAYDIGVGYGVPTGAGQPKLDVSSMSRFDFDMKWDTDSPELGASGVITVHLPCTLLQTSSVAPASGFSVDYAVTPNHDWTHYSLALAEFAQPHGYTVRIDKRQCLPVLDGVFFNLASPDSLADGQLANGSMIIDNVYLE